MVAGDLGMSPGKLAAQVAHAAVGLHRVLLEGRQPWLPAWEVKRPFCSLLKASRPAADSPVTGSPPAWEVSSVSCCLFVLAAQRW